MVQDILMLLKDTQPRYYASMHVMLPWQENQIDAC